MELDFYEHIEAYLKGSLSEEEEKSFEAAMESDPELKETVEEFPFLRKVMHEYVNEEAKSIVDAAASKVGKAAKKPRGPRGTIFLMARRAASILLLATAGMTIYSNTNYKTSNVLRAAHEMPIDMVFKSNQSLDQEWDQVMSLWNARKHQEAITSGAKLIDQFPDNALLKRNLAHMYLDQKAYTQAGRLFDQIVMDRRYQEDAEFHSALCKVGLEDETGLSSLESIAANQDHAFQEESQRVLKKLSSFWRRFVF